MMSFGFFDVIFWGKELEIDTYKPPNFIWSYHTHMVNTIMLTKVAQSAKIYVFKQF